MTNLDRVFETLPIGVWVATVPDGQVAYANPEFRNILGMDAVPSSRIGDAPITYGIFDAAGKPYPVEQLPFSRVVATGQPAVVDDLVIHRGDGKKVNIRAFAVPIRDPAGALTHVVIAFIDISQEARAEAGRRQTESRLSFVINNAPVALWSTDIEGVVTLSEGAGLASLGVRPGQLVGHNLFELYKDHPSIPGYIRRGLQGESFSYSVQVGDAVYDTWLMPLRDATGAVEGLAGLSRDVSEIRKLQTTAIQNDRAIALGTLAASLAHEINNPLTYMLGHLQFLDESLGRIERDAARLPEPAKSLAAEMRRALDPVLAGTGRIADITRELRTFSRLAPAEDDRADPRSVVTSVLKLVGKEVETRAQIHLDLRPTAPVRADTARLVQVVLNLVVNAMQALPADRPAVNRIWVSTWNEGPNVVIEVSDNGPGVPLEDRERIFEPFVTTKQVGEGSGLGLFVVRNIVRGFSGQVSVDDRPGGGARFRIVFPPAREASSPSSSLRPEAAAAAASGIILIVDDDALVADVLAAQLSGAGYRARVETDAARALEELAADGKGIDLVYCDLMMKGLSGMDLADALAARAPDQLAKVVFMTGGAFTPRARAFRDGHAAQCVDKPFDVLAETARRLRARRAP